MMCVSQAVFSVKPDSPTADFTLNMLSVMLDTAAGN
jgi:hypothetical protein